MVRNQMLIVTSKHQHAWVDQMIDIADSTDNDARKNNTFATEIRKITMVHLKAISVNRSLRQKMIVNTFQPLQIFLPFHFH